MTDKIKKRRKALAKKLGVTRRTAANIVRDRAASAPENQSGHSEPQRPQMRKEVFVRRYGRAVDAHYATVRPDAAKGETLAFAVAELVREAARFPDILVAEVRRVDRPGHPTVCTWERETSRDRWVFTWGPGADDRLAPLLPSLDANLTSEMISTLTAPNELTRQQGARPALERLLAEDVLRARRDAERRGIRIIHEASGRCAARIDKYPKMVEYGDTEDEAIRRLLETIWWEESGWSSRVDADSAEYIELQDD